MDKQAKRREKRRMAVAGFPQEFVFTDPEKLKDYFAGSKIQCLRCGKYYRKLGIHLLSIHGMEVDEYKAIYGIPWTKGLSCAETSELHANTAKENIKNGVWVVSKEQAALARLSLKRQRPKQPIRDVMRDNALREMNKDKTGEEAERRRNATKRGTPEHKERMMARPQMEKSREILKTYWKGKEQTDEHVFKRTGYHKKL